MNTEKKAALKRILCGSEGAEARDGLSALEIADVIANVAEHGAAERVARGSLAGASELTAAEKADLARLLGRASTPYERVLLVRCLRVLLDD